MSSATLSVLLRSGTRAEHERLGEQAFFLALKAGELTRRRYVGYLRAMAAIHYTLDRVLADAPTEALRQLAGESWLPGLCHDIAALEAAPATFGVPAALSMTKDILARAERAPFSLIGYRYTFEGSTLGMPELRRWVVACLELESSEHLRYLNRYGDQAPARWRSFRAQLDALELSDEQRSQALEGACAAFDQVAAIVSDLMWRHEAPILNSSAVNPVGGTYPIIQDPLLLEAVIVAGDLVYDQWPYFEARYAKRGRGFAHSDGAWLALTVDLTPARMHKQIDWLANVLSGRGIPAYLLEEHLRCEYRVVIEANPFEQPRFAPMLDAADRLRARRLEALSADLEQRLLAEFDVSVEGEDPLSLGRITLELVRDQLGDRPNGVESLLEWASVERVGVDCSMALRRLAALACKAT